MRKIAKAGVVLAGTTMAMGLAMPAFAAPTVSDNGNPMACFGQWRAYDASGTDRRRLGRPSRVSTSAPVTNADHSVTHKASCQPA